LHFDVATQVAEGAWRESAWEHLCVLEHDVKTALNAPKYKRNLNWLVKIWQFNSELDELKELLVKLFPRIKGVKTTKRVM
jgi:hypothetical protein